MPEEEAVLLFEQRLNASISISGSLHIIAA